MEQGLSVLGESVAQVILHSLDTKYSLKERDILKKPDRFVEVLQAMFGSGAATIEKLVVQSICSTVGLDPNSLDQPTLSHCMKQVEKAIKIKKKTGN